MRNLVLLLNKLVLSLIIVLLFGCKKDEEVQDTAPSQAAKTFADQHWSATRYTEWTLDNIGVLTNGALTRAQFENRVFTSDYDPALSNPPPFRDLVWSEVNLMEDSIGLSGPSSGNGYTHRLPNYAVQQYYELIGKYPQFSRGWDDCPSFGTPGYLIQSTDLPVKNISQKFLEYQQMLKQ